MSHFCRPGCRCIEHFYKLERRVHALIGGTDRPETIEEALERMCAALEMERKTVAAQSELLNSFRTTIHDLADRLMNGAK
jgi:hypothetical protein